MSSFVDPCSELREDPRLVSAFEHFNSCSWYSAHDAFEELWHESHGSLRTTLQGLLQIAVAELHFERGNINGATILFGEGLGRLKKGGNQNLGVDLQLLCESVEKRLKKLQEQVNLGQTS